MKSLYAVVTNGTMLYVQGELSEQECSDVDAFAKQFKTEDLDCDEICQAFIKAVEASLRIQLIQIPLKYVFRAN